MSDAEDKFLDRWRRERPSYAAWGAHVLETIEAKLRASMDQHDFELFLKIKPVPRVKEEKSLLAKAFQRKNYKNPYEGVEDKVGIRFVVLHVDDIAVVEAALSSEASWEAKKSRDFEAERLAKPFVFDYQSVHYNVWSRAILTSEGQEIRPDMACEVQIRTLLQHAYSELTHDTLYKPSVAASPKVERAAAKSMALIEATSDYFSAVRKLISEEIKPAAELLREIDVAYLKHFGTASEGSALNELIIDHYKQWESSKVESIEALLREKPYIIDRIKERRPRSILNRSSGILLLYSAVAMAPLKAPDESPVAVSDWTAIYHDLGEQMPDMVT
ncbi:GTP pyrophosphokinase [Aestuariivirga sp.]|uniref:GTP pyrophosphokinase n=1 Tax=Aestuariivirga sp. TaxID=2650926 RepID=UPI0039E384CC